MRWRDQLALTLPSLILRIVLAITFLWAGTGKIVGTTSVSGDAAARLANMQVPFLPEAEPPQSETPQSDRAAPVNPPPEDPRTDDQPGDPQPDAPDSDQEPQNGDEGAGDADNASDNPDPADPVALHNTRPLISLAAQAGGDPAVGSDFPEPVRVRRVHTLALLLHTSVNPALTPDSSPRPGLLPSWMGQGRTPVYLAWAAAITEILAGVLLLVGLVTRLSAFATLGIMVMAMWTTTVGPAAIQSSDAVLGFIPSADDPWAPDAYKTLLWQFALACASLSVVLLGPGPLSVDRLIFRPKRDPYESAEPAPRSAPKGVPEGAPDPNP